MGDNEHKWGRDGWKNKIEEVLFRVCVRELFNNYARVWRYLIITHVCCGGRECECGNEELDLRPKFFLPGGFQTLTTVSFSIADLA
jgi:hypothetical protein